MAQLIQLAIQNAQTVRLRFREGIEKTILPVSVTRSERDDGEVVHLVCGYADGQPGVENHFAWLLEYHIESVILEGPARLT